MGSNPAYAAVWEKRSGRDERMITVGEPWSSYQQHFEQYYYAGTCGGPQYVIDIVDGNDHGGYISVWRIGKDLDQRSYHHLTEDRLIKKFHLLKDDYKLAYISGYKKHTNDLRFAVIFNSNPKGDPWRFHYGMTKEDLISKVGTYTQEGLQIVHINSYKSGENIHYAAIWNNAQNANLEIELSPTLFNHSIISNNASGKSLKQITGL